MLVLAPIDFHPAFAFRALGRDDEAGKLLSHGWFQKLAATVDQLRLIVRSPFPSAMEEDDQRVLLPFLQLSGL
jgi:hypothetical protein